MSENFGWIFEDLNGVPITDTQLVSDYEETLRVASGSEFAKPIYSQFVVREAIGLMGARKYPVGNLEYGYLKAFHGEEAAMVALQLNYPERDGRRAVLGIIAGKEGVMSAPCGNCRDVMRVMVEPSELTIVSGALTGGRAVVTSLSDYLFEEYMPFEDLEEVLGLHKDKVRKQVLFELEDLREHPGGVDYNLRSGYAPFSPPINPFPERKYKAAIVTGNGFAYWGVGQGFAAYHHIYPLEDAILRADRDVSINHVVVVSDNLDGKPPDVMYRDRQQLFEHNLRQEDVLGRKVDPLVLLVNNHIPDDPKIWVTRIKEWLPMPFSADDFGADFREGLRGFHRMDGVIRTRVNLN